MRRSEEEEEEEEERVHEMWWGYLECLGVSAAKRCCG